MTSRKTNSSRKLSFQALENRCLMAGNVTVAVQNGILTITGDKNDSSIDVQQVAPGSYTVSGETGTTVNGKSTVQRFDGVFGDMNIDLKEGKDYVTFGVTGTHGDAALFMTFNRNLNIKLGDGDNVLSMVGVNVLGSLNVTGGSGVDLVALSDCNIGTASVNGGNNDCTFRLGAGKNNLTLNYVSVERDLNILDSLSTGDKITFNGGSAGRYIYLLTGNGDDFVQMDEVSAGLKLQVATGGGNDMVVLGGYLPGTPNTPAPQGVWADEVFVDLGDGTDVLRLGAGGVGANQATYLGGNGNDHYWNDGANPPIGTFSGFEGATKPHTSTGTTVGGQRTA